MNWFKKRSPDDLDAQLRGRRTEPRSEFTRSLARTITPEPRRAQRRPRYALAGGLAALALAAFTFAGGIGAASNAVGGTASVVSAFVPGHGTTSSGHGDNGQGNNGQGNYGQGNYGRGHFPGDDQYGHHCDHWYDHWYGACHKGGNGNGNGGNGNGHGNGGHGNGGNGNRGGSGL